MVDGETESTGSEETIVFRAGVERFRRRLTRSTATSFVGRQRGYSYIDLSGCKRKKTRSLELEQQVLSSHVVRAIRFNVNRLPVVVFSPSIIDQLFRRRRTQLVSDIKILSSAAITVIIYVRSRIERYLSSTLFGAFLNVFLARPEYQLFFFF